jgi:hypothetical protein
MKDSLEGLVEAGLMKPFEGSASQVKARLELAKRDIRVATATRAHARDWPFSIACNVILQATRASMFSRGFRPAAEEEQNKGAAQFAETVPGGQFKEDIHIFDKMRSKRNRVIYDISGGISQTEARQALAFPVRYVEAVKRGLKTLKK